MTAKIKKYTVIATVNTGVTGVKLTATVGGTEYEAVISGITATFTNITAGDYIVSATYNQEGSNDYVVDTIPLSAVTVAKNQSAIDSLFTVNAKVREYTVNGTVDTKANIEQIDFKQEKSVVKSVKENDIADNGVFTVDLPAGEYDVAVTAAEGYVVTSSPERITVAVGTGTVTPEISIVTEAQVIPPSTYTVSGTVDEHVVSVTLTQQGNEQGITLEAPFTDNKFMFTDLKAGMYTITAVPASGYKVNTIENATFTI